MAYFQKQLQDFGGDLPKAYAAYNAGPGATQAAIKNAPDGNWLTQLPKETQDYVTKNLQAYATGAGQPQRPTLADVEAKVRNDPSVAGNPDRLKIALTEVDRQYRVQSEAIQQQNDAAVATALRSLEQNGGRFSELPVTVRAAIPPDKLTTVMSAADRFAKGDDTTSLWLYNKLSNQPDYRAQEDIDKALRYLKKFDSEGVRKNLDADYLDQIDAMLERFDLRQRSDAERIRAASLRTWVQSRLNAGEIPDIAETLLSPSERARYLAAVQSRDANGNLIYADDEDAIKLLADAIDTSAQRHYRDLTVEELMGLRDTITSIEHLARLKHRLLTAAGDRDYEAVRDEIATGIAAHASASGRNNRRQ